MRRTEKSWKANGRGGNPGNMFKPAGPRGTPAVDGDKIYILSALGELVCFTTEGKEVWRDHVKDFQGIMPSWGFGESPLVDGDKLICTPGAEDAVLMALDKNTGRPLWARARARGAHGRWRLLSAGRERPIPLSLPSSSRVSVSMCSSLPLPLVGVSAADGKLRWRYDRASNTHRINCSTPLYHDGTVFAASAYDAGGGMVKLRRHRRRHWGRRRPGSPGNSQNHHGGVIPMDGALYGQRRQWRRRPRLPRLQNR